MKRLFSQPAGSPEARRRLIRGMIYEVVPMKNVDGQIPHLPAGCPVSVTCSPVKGIDATLDLTEQLVEAGHRTVPHLAARMVEDADHLDRIAARVTALGLRELFVIAGDAPEPHGPFEDSLTFLRELLDLVEVDSIGVAAYPDGHALIPTRTVRDALYDKQALFADAGVDATVTTQMCFDADAIQRWLEYERDEGLTMPVLLGVPGSVDRAKLLTMGMRLGVGNSLRFLKKNRSAVGRLLSPGGFDPDRLVRPLSGVADELDIVGLHAFTFNQVEATADWQQAALG